MKHGREDKQYLSEILEPIVVVGKNSLDFVGPLPKVGALRMDAFRILLRPGQSKDTVARAETHPNVMLKIILFLTREHLNAQRL